MIASNRIETFKEGFQHPGLIPWRWCGRRWEQVTKPLDGSVCSKVAQVVGKILATIPLSLLTALAFLPAVFGVFNSSFHIYSIENLPIKEAHREYLKKAPGWQFDFETKERVESLYSIESFRPFSEQKPLPYFVVTMKRTSTYLQKIFDVLSSSFRTRNSSPSYDEFLDLIFDNTMTEEKNQKLREAFKHCFLVELKVNSDLKELCLIGTCY